jgi:hypothetical protein
MTKTWLKAVDWSVVCAINQQLCAAKHAQYGPTSDGHATTKALWEKSHREPLALDALVEFCRRCHQLAPFLNYNGNTFVAIARQVIGMLPPGANTAALRSLAGHIIAGTASAEERKAFQAAVAILS